MLKKKKSKNENKKPKKTIFFRTQPPHGENRATVQKLETRWQIVFD